MSKTILTCKVCGGSFPAGRGVTQRKVDVWDHILDEHPKRPVYDVTDLDAQFPEPKEAVVRGEESGIGELAGE